MKILVTGDGAMVYCKDKKLIQKLRYESYLGLKTMSGYSNPIDNKWWEFDVESPGSKATMNDISAAIGIEQLKKVKSFLVDQMGVTNIRFPDTSSLGVKPVSKEGTERLVRAALEVALKQKRKSLTLVHKGNIIFKVWLRGRSFARYFK